MLETSFQPQRYEIMEIKHGRAAMLGFLHVTTFHTIQLTQLGDCISCKSIEDFIHLAFIFLVSFVVTLFVTVLKVRLHEIIVSYQSKLF